MSAANFSSHALVGWFLRKGIESSRIRPSKEQGICVEAFSRLLQKTDHGEYGNPAEHFAKH